MTGQEIVRALRCCAKGLGHDDACENCKVGEIQDRREYIEFAAANAIERLTAENAALREKVPQWISIVDMARYFPSDGWTCDNWEVPQNLITHWMPPPEAPEVDL